MAATMAPVFFFQLSASPFGADPSTIEPAELRPVFRLQRQGPAQPNQQGNLLHHPMLIAVSQRRNRFS